MTRVTPKALAGLVLCGGASARMGREKALIRVAGRPLFLHVAALLGRAADPVLIAPGRPGRLGRLTYQEVEDEVPHSGPLGGLVAGLAASPHPLVAVAAGDMPFASPSLFRRLADLHGDEDAVVPRTQSGSEPLHAVYATAAVAKLRGALADRKLALHAVLSGLRVRWVGEDECMSADPSGRFALNVNRVEDLELIQDQ
jgi:molybdopterin-guanine dinucleotide biosynthesis protein A